MRFRLYKCGTSLLPVFGPLSLILAIWYGVSVAAELNKGIDFPDPLETATRLLELLRGSSLHDASIYRHIYASLMRWIKGFAMAVGGGVLLGLGAGWWRLMYINVAPLLHILQLIPGLAWIPVALLLYGIGEEATIFILAITAFTPIAISTMDGVRQVDTGYIRAARMLGAGRRAMFMHVLLPAALPSMLTGLRIGLGNGWRVLLAAEMVVGTGTGLGFSIIEARWTLDYTAAFALIGVIAVLGLVFERIFFTSLEQRTIRAWNSCKD